jgi:uncharacterized membrane protein YeaQ/YmgE (transglycosylase-associated protein family)
MLEQPRSPPFPIVSRAASHDFPETPRPARTLPDKYARACFFADKPPQHPDILTEAIMNTALAILAHALRMLIFETTTTVRVIMPALVLVLGCSLAIAVFAPEMVTLMQVAPDVPTPPAPQTALGFLVFGVIGLMGYALMAILWHRHVLLNGAERPENLRPDSRIFFIYIWRAIVVGFAQMLAAIPITLLIGVLGSSIIQNNPTGPLATLLGLIGGIVFLWIAMRLSVVLPSAAIGRPMSMRESWHTTKPATAALWGVAVLLSGLNMCVYMISATLLPETGTAPMLVQTVIYIFEGLVFVSILTTLYGHLVEGRSLGQ